MTELGRMVDELEARAGEERREQRAESRKQ
jgi:hypothetical protein